ncbi:hypothetical protein Cgig2_010228 [Carnegiea gigantea]|uniref:Terpene synthase N-terminal domain-containing protein n=1 Tax=Carnegiea gigantea TaxID=171969 RepID=A0A9Q1GHE1_9CARY|nr:hypothetical protein Cgig2_010228 [Carnegiea gigantea]
MENSVGVAGQNASSKEIKNCYLAQYHPDLWGGHFLYYTPPPQDIICQEEHALDELKKEVRKKLLTAIENPKDKLGFVDATERPGVAYHFEEEIGIILQEFHDNDNQKKGLYGDDLYYVSLRFGLLRQHSFYGSSGKLLFKLLYMYSLNSKMRRIVLWMGRCLRVHGEDILGEALEVTETKLEEMPKCPISLLADSNIILADVAHVKSATHDHDSTNEDTLIAMIESGDENGNDMDDVPLDLDQIEETNLSIESLKK